MKKEFCPFPHAFAEKREVHFAKPAGVPANWEFYGFLTTDGTRPPYQYRIKIELVENGRKGRGGLWTHAIIYMSQKRVSTDRLAWEYETTAATFGNYGQRVKFNSWESVFAAVKKWAAKKAKNR